MRVDDSKRGWQPVTHLVMVRDDHIKTELIGHLDFLLSRSPAVRRHQQADAALPEPMKRLCIEAIPFFFTMRDVCRDVCTETLKECHIDARRRYAVHVVVSVKTYAL